MSAARTCRLRRRQAKLDTRYAVPKAKPPKRLQGRSKLEFQKAVSDRAS